MFKKIYFNLLLLFTMLLGLPCMAVTPMWVDTQNPVGPKVYIDVSNQYYFQWGQVYTVKYEKGGKTIYTQIELKGLRGNRAAILSTGNTFKDTYTIPPTRNYIDIGPDQAIYNSTKMAIMNTNKPTCPRDVCLGIAPAGTGNLVAYRQYVERQINKNWKQLKYSKPLKTTVKFTISKRGNLLDCKITSPSGEAAFDDEAIKAVKFSAPFNPLPASFTGQSIEMEYNFCRTFK